MSRFQPAARLPQAAVLLLGAVLLVCLAAPVHARVFEGVKLAEKIVVAGVPLRLRGVALREATVFKVDVFVAGLYVPHKARIPNALLEGKTAWRLDLHFLRNIDRERYREGWRDKLHKRAGKRLARVEARIGALVRLFPAIRERDRHSFQYVPSEGLSVLINGVRRGTLAGADFAGFIAAGFVGRAAPKEFREGLLGRSRTK